MRELKLYPYQEEMKKKLNSGDNLRFAQQSFMNGRQYGKATMKLAQFLKPKIVEQTYIAKSIKKRYGIDLNEFDRQEIFYRDPVKQAMLDKMKLEIEELNRFVVSGKKSDYELVNETLNRIPFYGNEDYYRLVDRIHYGLLVEDRFKVFIDSKA